MLRRCLIVAALTLTAAGSVASKADPARSHPRDGATSKAVVARSLMTPGGSPSVRCFTTICSDDGTLCITFQTTC